MIVHRLRNAKDVSRPPAGKGGCGTDFPSQLSEVPIPASTLDCGLLVSLTSLWFKTPGIEYFVKAALAN